MIIKKDKKGNVIYTKDCYGVKEYWYDDKGNVIHAKYPNGNELWCNYDDNGKRIHTKFFNGTKPWFDDNGNEYWFNDKDIVIHEKCFNGDEYWLNDNGELIRDNDNGITSYSSSPSQLIWGCSVNTNIITIDNKRYKLVEIK